MKKSVGIIGIVLSVVLLSVAYFFIKTRSNAISEPIIAVPGDAVMVMRINKPFSLSNSILHENENWQALRHIAGLGYFYDNLYKMDSLLSGNQELADLIAYQPSFISLHETVKNKLTPLYLLATPIYLNNKKVIQLIESTFQQVLSIQHRKYEDTQIYDISLTNNQNISLSTSNGILFISTSAVLVEDAIRHSKVNKHLTSDKNFAIVYNTLGNNAEANLLFNTHYFSLLLNTMLNKYGLQETMQWNKAGNWVGLDVKMNHAYMLLNGFTQAQGGDELLSYFKTQTAGKNEIINYLPDNTSMYIGLKYGNPENFNQYLKKFNQSHNTHLPQTPATELLNNFFSRVCNGYACISYTQHVQKNKLIILSTVGNTITEKELNTLSGKLKTQNLLSNNKIKSKYKFDNNIHVDIYHFGLKNMVSSYFGRLFNIDGDAYAMVYDNHLVISANPKNLETLITSHIRGELLYNKPSYQKVSEFYPGRSNIIVYAALNQIIPGISKYLSDKLNTQVNNHLLEVKQAGGFGAHFFVSNQMLNTNIFLTKVPMAQQQKLTVWETLLDTTTHFKPKLVKNHYTGDPEIITQDMNNTLYLINKAGRVLWKLPLNEAINSEIYEIDYYKNNKVQYLFSTRHFIYLFDRLGNYVEDYPIRLRAPSTKGISVFDYDHDKNYRIFAPCENNKVYVYNIEGRILKGWEFEKTEHEIISPVQHFRVKNNDYIVFADKQQAYILNRRGQIRVKPDTRYIPSGNLFYLEARESIEKSYLYTTDTSGRIIHYYLDGNTLQREFYYTSKNHSFIGTDINNDGQPEYIYFSRGKLEVINQTGIQFFSYQIADTAKQLPNIFVFNHNDIRIGLYSNQNQNLYLINNKGKLTDGFPLNGNSPFSIGYLNQEKDRLNLVCTNNNHFLLNYAVY